MMMLLTIRIRKDGKNIDGTLEVCFLYQILPLCLIVLIIRRRSLRQSKLKTSDVGFDLDVCTASMILVHNHLRQPPTQPRRGHPDHQQDRGSRTVDGHRSPRPHHRSEGQYVAEGELDWIQGELKRGLKRNQHLRYTLGLNGPVTSKSVNDCTGMPK